MLCCHGDVTQDEGSEHLPENYPLILDQGKLRDNACVFVTMVFLEMPSRGFEIVKKFEMVSEYLCVIEIIIEMFL